MEIVRIPIKRKKKPYWIAITTDFLGRTNTFECSECGSRSVIATKDKRCWYKYCPFCGVELEKTKRLECLE